MVLVSDNLRIKAVQKEKSRKVKNQKCQHVCLQQSLYCIVNVYFRLSVATEIFLHECCGLFTLTYFCPYIASSLLILYSLHISLITDFICIFWITIMALQKKQRAFLNKTIQNTTLNQFLSLLQKHPLTCKKYPATENPLGLLITPVASHPCCSGRHSWYQPKLFNFQ